MISIRRIRFFGWLLRALVGKYRRALILGFLVGLGSTIAVARISPWVTYQWFTKTVHIGVVGEFTPTTLPLSLQRYISHGLTAVGADGSAQPDLAVSWESTESGKLYVFHLRDGIHWHNGKAVSAGDVNYNIRGVTFHAIDPLTLEVKLSTAYSPFPLLVSKPIFQAGLRGVGPYRVAGIRLKGDTVSLIKLVPVTDRTLPVLDYRFYRTEALAILAFKRGDVDVLEEISSIQTLEDWKGISPTEETNYDRIVALFFNLNVKILQDKSLRQALGYALPQLPGERATGPLSKTSWAYTDKVRVFEPDPDQLAGLVGRTKTATSTSQLTLTTFPSYLDVAQSIASAWTEAGLPTTVKVTNSVTDDFEVLLSAQDLPPDPDQYPFWHSTQTQTNITGYTNVKIDKLLEDGRQEEDRAKRETIYADFQRRLVEDAPVIFLYYPKMYTIRRGK